MKFSTQAGIIADGGTHGFIRIYRETLRCLIQRWKIEQQLRAAGEKGAEICVFGDIDLEPHRQWCTARCTAVGMEACFPLWQENRKALVLEFLDTGYRTLITTVDTSRMDASFLGRELDHDVVDEIEACGADACGENGEYHTFVFSGPMMSVQIPYLAGETILQGQYAIMPVLSAVEKTMRCK